MKLLRMAPPRLCQLVIIWCFVCRFSSANILCENGEDSKLSLIGDKSKIIGIDSRNETRTVFLTKSESFTFTCHNFKKKTPTKITFGFDAQDHVHNLTTQNGQRSLKVSRLRNALRGRGESTEPEFVQCLDVCSVNIVVVKFNGSQICNVSKSVHCDIDQLNEVLPTAKTPGLAIARSNLFFPPVITYSVLDPVVGYWQKCNETDANGEVIKVEFSSGEDDTEYISCPIAKSSSESRPVIIRVEDHPPKSKSCLAGLCKPQQPNYSYFTSQVNGDVDKEGSPVSLGLEIFGILFVVLLIVSIALVGSYLCYQKSRFDLKQNSSEFYVDIEKPEKDGVTPYLNDDNDSMKTESTMANNYNMTQFSSVISDEDILGPDFTLGDDSEEGKNLRKKILSRQLSGDPKRYNPDIAMNQQAPILAYNSEYEIDRSNFEIGKLLGSGNFGCVYEGIATGLFHPGSKTKVAIKTVNDGLTKLNLSPCYARLRF